MLLKLIDHVCFMYQIIKKKREKKQLQCLDIYELSIKIKKAV